MVVFGHFVFNSLFTFLYVTCSFLDILQFLSISHLWIFRFTAHKTLLNPKLKLNTFAMQPLKSPMQEKHF